MIRRTVTASGQDGMFGTGPSWLQPDIVKQICCAPSRDRRQGEVRSRLRLLPELRQGCGCHGRYLLCHHDPEVFSYNIKGHSVLHQRASINERTVPIANGPEPRPVQKTTAAKQRPQPGPPADRADDWHRPCADWKDRQDAPRRPGGQRGERGSRRDGATSRMKCSRLHSTASCPFTSTAERGRRWTRRHRRRWTRSFKFLAHRQMISKCLDYDFIGWKISRIEVDW